MLCYDASKHHPFWTDNNLSPIRNSEDVVTHWLWTQRDISDHKASLDLLTDKEYKVVMAVSRNSETTLRDIADSMHISEHTLRNHLASIYDKLGLKNRLELYVFCSKFLDDHQ
jgi:DNA-binding CsgD family transcriptional regulator